MQVAIDSLKFRVHVLDLDPQHVKSPPKDGVHIHGLYMEGAKWDRKKRAISDSNPRELYAAMPVLWLEPTAGTTRPRGAKFVAEVPLYKTSQRAGVLSTTGHSTNFVMMILLNSLEKEEKWIRRGVAMLTQLND
jgi:dynein heavy chain